MAVAEKALDSGKPITHVKIGGKPFRYDFGAQPSTFLVACLPARSNLVWRVGRVHPWGCSPSVLTAALNHAHDAVLRSSKDFRL
jgi:hypothetical protein